MDSELLAEKQPEEGTQDAISLTNKKQVLAHPIFILMSMNTVTCEHNQLTCPHPGYRIVLLSFFGFLEYI
jgi:hypothetical protein